MDPITAITGTWESLKVATGLGKAVMDLKIEGEVREKVIAMRDALLDAQQRMFEVQASQMEMMEKVRKLEEELAKYQGWEREKERYALHQTEAGALVYRIKPEMQGTDPLHDLCSQCFEDEIKSILQPAKRDGRFDAVCCHRCNSVIRVKYIPVTPLNERLMAPQSRNNWLAR